MVEPKLPSLKKNYIFNTLLTGVNIIFPIFVLTYSARILGPTPMGLFYFAANLAAYFLVLSGNAIPLYGVREISKVRDDPLQLEKTVSELFVLNLVLSISSTLLFAITVLVTPKFNHNIEIFMVMGGTILFQGLSVDYLFQGLERYGNLTFRSILTKAITMVFILDLVRKPSDYLIYAFIYASGNLINNFAGLYNLWRHTRLRFHGLDVKKHLRPALPLLIFFLIASVYVNFDSVLLGLLSNEYSVGIYNIGMKTNRLVIAMVSSMGIVLVPRFSYYLQNELMVEYRELAGRAIEFLYLLSFLIGTSLFFSAPILIPILFGQKFIAAVSTVQLATPNILIISLSGFLGMQILFPMGKERLLIWTTLGGSSISLLLGFILIPRLNHNGSAIASVCSELTVFGLLILLSKKSGVTTRLVEARHLIYPLCSLAIVIPSLLARIIWGPGSLNVLGAVGLGTIVFAWSWAKFRRDLALEITTFIRMQLNRILKR